ncbi:MAG: isoprenyl transferase [Candidatus Omnitrophota bacterium]|nr:MAG: isoprenyl transferase [Candidatus Omnitrophota bacterium]
MKIPKHIAIIMDGNGRWAKDRGLPRFEGHREGMERVREVIRQAQRLGVKAITLFAFSTENWDRPRSEIKFLFSSLEKFIDKYLKELQENDIKLQMIGRRDRIDKKVIKRIEEAERSTKENKSFLINVALDYGGRWDIVEGAKKLLANCRSGVISEDDIDEASFSKSLALADIPDPDLLIRTSGEQRISNFLLWNLAYAELYFPEVFWPEFNGSELKKAINAYGQRQRRFGGV